MYLAYSGSVCYFVLLRECGARCLVCHAYVERAVCSGRVAAYWKRVTLGKNELALYYYAN